MASNPAIASLLQSQRPAGRVAELGSFGSFSMKALISLCVVLVTACHLFGAEDALTPANIVALSETNDHRLCATVVVTNLLPVAIDCSLYIVPLTDTAAHLTAGSTSVIWSIVEAHGLTNAPAVSYTPLMGFRYGLSGPVVHIPSGAAAELRSLPGAVTATNANLLIILQQPTGTPPAPRPGSMMAARLGNRKEAGPVGPANTHPRTP